MSSYPAYWLGLCDDDDVLVCDVSIHVGDNCVNSITQSQTDDAENPTNTGHSLTAKQFAIIQAKVSGRAIYNQGWSVR